MTPADTARVLALVQAFDNRNVDELVIGAWHSTLGDLGFDDCCAAVREYYTRHGAWLMPDTVREGVMRIRRARLDAVVEPIPNVDPDRPREFAAAVRATRQAIADGHQPPPERLRLEGSRGLPDGFVETFRDVRETTRQRTEPGDPAAAAAEAERRANEERIAREEIQRLHEQHEAGGGDEAADGPA
jgi:hypothetical protein